MVDAVDSHSHPPVGVLMTHVQIPEGDGQDGHDEEPVHRTGVPVPAEQVRRRSYADGTRVQGSLPGPVEQIRTE